jgi:hypothetical protein
MFDKLPDLETGLFTKLWELCVKPFFFMAAILQGSTAITIDSRGRVRFKPMHVVDDPAGIVVDGEFVPHDGLFSVWNVTFAILVEDITALLNPSSMEVEREAVADVDLRNVTVVTLGSGRSLRAALAWPFWVLGTAFMGMLAIQVDKDGNLRFKKATRVDEPDPGFVVGDEFKHDRGKGAVFKRWSTNIIFPIKGWESLWNPATSELLRAKDEAEATGKAIADGEGKYAGVKVHDRIAVGIDRLNEYAPFALFDGSQTRKQMQTASIAREKHSDTSTLAYIGGLLMAFMLGAITPRLNGMAGGGGGGGSVPIPMPTILPMDALNIATDVLAAGVV